MTRMHRLVPLLAASITAAAAAQDSPPAPTAPSEPPPQQASPLPQLDAAPEVTEPARSGRVPTFTVEFGGGYQFETDIDSGGSFSLARGAALVSTVLPVAERMNLRIAAGYSYSSYDFTDNARFGGSGPWEGINSVSVLASLGYQIDEKWSVFGGPIFGIAAESSADLGDGLNGGGMAGFGYNVSEDLTLRLGVSVISQIKDNVQVFPIIGLDWTIDSERSWGFNLGSIDTGALEGIGGELVFNASKQLSISGGAAYSTRRFRLDDEGFAPDGVGEDSRVAIFGRLGFKASDAATISLFGGVAVAGNLEIDDSYGNQLFSEDYDAAPFVGASVAIRF
ncbi:MAG: hypothetical protein KF745_04530 [Phycisphaeraceae bacterium]|nr:hypothetical protein [Phycisphaeraceae bacterium]